MQGIKWRFSFQAQSEIGVFRKL